MAKKKATPEDAAPPIPPAEAEELEPKRPERSWRYATSKSSQVEVAVWLNPVEVPGGEIVPAWTVTNHRSYKDDQGWHKNGFYRLGDLPTLIFALQQAYEWIMSQRDLNNPLTE